MLQCLLTPSSSTLVHVSGHTTVLSSRKHYALRSDISRYFRAVSTTVASKTGYKVRSLPASVALSTDVLAANLFFCTREALTYVAASVVAPTNVESGKGGPSA